MSPLQAGDRDVIVVDTENLGAGTEELLPNAGEQIIVIKQLSHNVRFTFFIWNVISKNAWTVW